MTAQMFQLEGGPEDGLYVAVDPLKQSEITLHDCRQGWGDPPRYVRRCYISETGLKYFRYVYFPLKSRSE